MSGRATEQALFDAILEEPDDDAVRLVYADWLEEHAEADRAARIRLECQLARLPDYDPRTFDVRAALGIVLGPGERLHSWGGGPTSFRGLDWHALDIAYYTSLSALPDSFKHGRAECLWCYDNRGNAFPSQLLALLEAFPAERLPRIGLENWGDRRSILETATASGRLAGLRDLTVIFGDYEAPPASLARSLAEFPRLESLRLASAADPRGPQLQVRAEDLLRGCSGLRRLNLSRAACDPLPGLAEALPRLEVLSLAEAQVVPSLADLPPRLRELYLPRTRLGPGRLPRLERLERLDLGGCVLGDLSSLAELGQLRTVNLSTLGGLPSTGIGLWPPRFDPLTFRVYDSPHWDSPTAPPAPLDLGPLRGLPELEAIDARGHVVRLAHLLPLPKLRAIRLRGPEIDDEAAERLAGCPTLTAIDLEGSSITDAGLCGLSALPLASLRLGACWLISDEGFRALAGCPTLREVVLADTALGPPGLEALGRLPRLARLDIRKCESLSPDDLAQVASFPALRSLAFSDRRDVAPHHVTALAGVPDLELDFTSQNDPGGMRSRALLNAHPGLRWDR